MTWLSTNIFPIVLGIMPSTSWQSLSVVSVTFQRRELDHFSCGKDYEWHILPPSVRSGGILLGIHSTYLELLSTSKGEYHIKFHLRNKSDNFIWSLVAVYGAAQDEFKAAFLKELVNTCRENPHPMLLGGDFNIL